MTRSRSPRSRPARKSRSSQDSPQQSAASKESFNPNALLLEILPQSFGICRLKPDADFPSWALDSKFLSVSRSPEELSVVCDDKYIPRRLRCERGRRALRVAGTLDFALVGVLAAIARPLAEAEISIFVVSTFDTDYVLIPGDQLDKATDVLRQAGHRFDGDAKDGDAKKGDAKKDDAEKRDTEKIKAKPKAKKSQTEKKRRSEPEPELEEQPEPKKRLRRKKVEADPEREKVAEEKPEPKKRLRRKKVEADPEREVAAEEKPEPKKRVRRKKAEADPERDRASEEKPEPKKRTRRKKADAKEQDGEKAASTKRSSEKTKKAEEKPKRHQSEKEAEGAEAKDFFTGGISQNPVEITDKSFTDLGLGEDIAATIREQGFINPTPVQAGVIPDALTGKDMIGLAETGSGKTAAFCLPLADKLVHGQGVRGLILCPTREIALQTQAFLNIFGRNHDLETAVVIGGVRMQPQINALMRKPDIIVATPGRLADHMRRRNVSLSKLEMLVLDEADHMLDLGFLPQIKEILEQIPENRQTMMFSATMPKPIARLTQRFMQDPLTVDLRPSGRAAEGIEHRLYLVDENDKKACLLQLLREVKGSTLIFMRRKLHTEWLARQVEAAGFDVERIHSDRSQGQRVNALRSIREGDNRVLVATDVAARGIDLPLIEHVINYDLPEHVEDYVHRAGRTARGNNKGIVSSVATWKDKIMIGDLEHGLEIELPRCKVEGIDAYEEIKRRKTVRRRRLL